MALSKRIREKAIAEIVASLPAKTEAKNARKIAEEKLAESITDITDFHQADTLVLEKQEPATRKYLRTNHRKLSLAIMTSYPGMSRETAKEVYGDIFD